VLRSWLRKRVYGKRAVCAAGCRRGTAENDRACSMNEVVKTDDGQAIRPLTLSQQRGRPTANRPTVRRPQTVYIDR